MPEYALLSILLLPVKKHLPKKILNQFIEPTDTTDAVRYEGIFLDGPSDSVSGYAKAYLKKGEYILALENFSTSNGPDLKVYILKEIHPVNFMKLGDLQSTNGNKLYNMAGSPDFALYKYALIHCEKYNCLYGLALLIKK